MEKVVKFRVLIKKHRKQLIKYGFKECTVNSWVYSNRVPTEANAKAISALLGVPLVEVPYYRVEHVI